MKKAAVLFLLATAGVCLHAQTLSWDIKFLKGSDKVSVPVSQIIRMEDGEDFLLTITPAADCFGYIVYYDSNREVSVLYNAPIKQGSDVYLGPFEVEDPPGTETLYVIISLDRQTKLENLIQAFNRNQSRQNANNLYREVVSLQNAASGLGEPASVFIASGGTARGDSKEYATRFSEKKMYVRAISIRH